MKLWIFIKKIVLKLPDPIQFLLFGLLAVFVWFFLAFLIITLINFISSL